MQTLEKHDDEIFKERLDVCVVQPFDTAMNSLMELIKNLAGEKIQPELIAARDLVVIIVQSNEIKVSDVLDQSNILIESKRIAQITQTGIANLIF